MSTPDLPLSSLQSWMQQALMAPRATDPEETERLVTGSPRLSAQDCLAIYQRSYSLRLLRCMDEQFPALRHALGRGLFADFAREYLQALPSESYTLYDLGRRFPAFLAENRPDRDRPEGERELWIDFMLDLAQCERDIFVMFDAPGHEGKPFAVVETPDAHLRLQPCFALHRYRFPVNGYYHEVREGRDPPLPPLRDTRVALVRRDFLTRTVPLSEPHFDFLAAVASGASVAVALESVARRTGQPAEEVSRAWASSRGVRRQWIEAGFFIDAREEPAGPGSLEAAGATAG